MDIERAPSDASSGPKNPHERAISVWYRSAGQYASLTQKDLAGQNHRGGDPLGAIFWLEAAKMVLIETARKLCGMAERVIRLIGRAP